MLKKLREKQGITQSDLAAALGYTSPQFISNIERGIAMLPVRKYRKTAKLLKVSPEKLINIKLAHTRKALYRAFGISK